ncbi:MAG TPA: glycosyltransferase family 39 protein [Thermoflexia bacterium]|nr:glycosyltransferase family 39 protein [Thermoflexia bacterium]
MNKRIEQILIRAILAIFAVLGVTYSVVVPPFEASDEVWHYPMVKYIADHWDLPVMDPNNVGPWRQEGGQPPLYYALGAAITFWIDTSDMEQVRRLNPHVDAGVATPDGNVNLVVHNPALERFPWRGTVLAVHLVRFLSVLMGTASVYFTYRIVREIVQDDPLLPLAAAAVHAFTPMFVFIAGSVNNDNLVVMLCGLGLWMLLRLAKEEAWTSRHALVRYLVLGIVLGMAALSKTSALGLTVVTAVVVTMRAVRRRSWREFLLGGFATLLPFLAVVGWWYLRNLRLYGDLTGLNVFTQVSGSIRPVPADLAQLWRERYSFLAGYWGNFGALNVPMSPWVYTLLNALLLLSLLGLFLRLLRLPDYPVSLSPRSLFLALLWAALVFIPWIGWSRVTWSSQGRLVFPAISVWSFLLVLGLHSLTSGASRVIRHTSRITAVVAHLYLFLPAMLLALAVVAPFAWIAPAYALPEPLGEDEVAAIPHRLGVEFGGVMRLLGYDLEADAVEPGGRLGVTLYWEALAPTDRDHTVFVHLLGEGDLIIAQRDTFPGVGLLSTTWLEPGFRWADRYVLQIPATAYTPDVAQVEVGVYDATTGSRLPASTGGDQVRFGRVLVQPLPGDVPNPIEINFGDRMALVGYRLSDRVVRPGDTITLTLYWRGLRPMDVNYTISAQLIDAQQRKAAQSDGWPRGGEAPTAAWQPGEIVADPRSLEIAPDAPPGVYALRIVVYVLQEEEIVHLPMIPEGGRMLENYVVLTKVRVVP